MNPTQKQELAEWMDLITEGQDAVPQIVEDAITQLITERDKRIAEYEDLLIRKEAVFCQITGLAILAMENPSRMDPGDFESENNDQP